MKATLISLVLLLALQLHLQPTAAQDYPTAYPSTTWTNGANVPHTVSYPDGSTVKAILLASPPQSYGPTAAAGFYCRAPQGTSACTDYLFAVFIVYVNSGALITNPTIGIPQVVWSANRNRPVKLNAVLQFTADGNLILKDANGTVVWSTGTAGRSVSSLSITSTGNLALLNGRGNAAWQSLDHPTDTLLPGQQLFDGQTLYSSVSNWDFREGLYSLTATSGGFRAFVKTAQSPRLYYEAGSAVAGGPATKNYLMLQNGSLSFFKGGSVSWTKVVPPAPSVQYLRLDQDGHLRVYQWRINEGGWKAVAEIIPFP